MHMGNVGIRTKTMSMEFSVTRPDETPADTLVDANNMTIDRGDDFVDEDPTWPYERTDVFVGRTRTESWRK